MFLCFLLFSSISLVALIASAWFYSKKENVSSVVKGLDDIYILSLKDFKLQQDFLNYETTNPYYFKTNHSVIVDKQRVLEREIQTRFSILMSLQSIATINSTRAIDSIKIELKRCQGIFEKVKEQLVKRGYQDFGMEGEMRLHAHALMNLGEEIDQVQVLMLRRHEKDFIIRKENIYVDKFNLLIHDVRDEIEHRASIPLSRKKVILATIDNYAAAFNKLVFFEKTLGIRGQNGLIFLLSRKIYKIQNYFETQKFLALRAEESIYIELNAIATMAMVLVLLLTLFLSYFVASAISKPLVSLTYSIKGYVNSNFAYFLPPSAKSSNYEIEILKENFVKMSGEITSHINYFKEKVEERTKEIRFQKDEIVKQKSEIIEQRDRLEIQKQILQIQKQLVLEKNKGMEDSIRYAMRIQKAILPQVNAIKSFLPDSFVYYQPKDIVSGDFYWIDQPKSSSKIFFAAVDCTGHGVPGAFMSIVGYNGLNKIIQEYRLCNPAAILNQLNIEVRKTLRQENDSSEVKDGMDIALCSLDRGANILEYAGANNPLYLIRNGQLQVFNGDKFPIGMYKEGKNTLFHNRAIELEKGDAIYVFTDGYIDQFGGPDGKKFKQRQFKELLLSIQHLEMEDQKIIIQETIENWRGHSFQVDDVLVIGVKI